MTLKIMAAKIRKNVLQYPPKYSAAEDTGCLPADLAVIRLFKIKAVIGEKEYIGIYIDEEL
jgi:hypothetical protein